MKKNGLVSTRNNGQLSNGLFEFPSIDSWFDEFFNHKPFMKSTSVNVIEKDKDYTFEVSAPGFDKSNFDIQIDGDVIEITGNYTNEMDENDGNYKQREFTYSSFKRRFSLPKDVIQDKISAKYENGILNITIPKSNNKYSPNKRIEIQ